MEKNNREQFKEKQLKKLAYHLFQLVDYGGTYTSERIERLEYEIIKLIKSLKTIAFYGSIFVLGNLLITILLIIKIF